MNDDIEPTILLSTGTTVTRAIYDIVSELQSKGHTITVSDRGDVFIEPMVHPDTWYCLDASYGETAAVLDAIGSIH
jgi:hypothetical protein